MADEQGEEYVDDADIEPPFVKLMDTLAFGGAMPARRLIEMLKKRGWTGWTKLERVDPTRSPAGVRQETPRCSVSGIGGDGGTRRRFHECLSTKQIEIG